MAECFDNYDIPSLKVLIEKMQMTIGVMRKKERGMQKEIDSLRGSLKTLEKDIHTALEEYENIYAEEIKRGSLLVG